MNVPRGLRYMFYRVYSYQLKPWKDVPIFAAHIGVYAVTLAIGLNITALLFALSSSVGNRHVQPGLGILIFLVLFVFFYFHFIPHERYKKIIEEFADERRSEKIRNGIVLWSYCVVTIVLLFASVLYFQPANR